MKVITKTHPMISKPHPMIRKPHPTIRTPPEVHKIYRGDSGYILGSVITWLLKLPWTDLLLDPGPLSIELPWTGYSEPRTLNITHVETKSPLKKTRQS